MKHIYNLAAGAFMSVGFSSGISFGATSIIFAIFDRMVETLSFKKGKFKKNLPFLLTIILGGALATFLFSSLVDTLTEGYPVPTQFFFMGTIVGCFPIAKRFFKGVSLKSKSTAIPFAVAAAAMIILSFLPITEHDAITDVGVLTSVALYGICVIGGVSTFIPSVSGSVIIKLFGLSETVEYAKTHLAFDSGVRVILPVALGYLTGFVLAAIIAFKLIKSCKNGFYSAVFGLMVGSLFVLFPVGFSFNFTGLYAFICLACGTIFSYYIGEMSRNEKQINDTKENDGE